MKYVLTERDRRDLDAHAEALLKERYPRSAQPRWRRKAIAQALARELGKDLVEQRSKSDIIVAG